MGVINHILLHFYDVSAVATRCAIGEKNHQKAKSFFLLPSIVSFSFSWIHLKADWYQRWGSLCILAKARPWRIWCVLSAAAATVLQYLKIFQDDVTCDMLKLTFFTRNCEKCTSSFASSDFSLLSLFAYLQTFCLIYYFNWVASEASDCRRSFSSVAKFVFVVYESITFFYLNEFT